MQVPYFIQIACKTVYKHEEQLISEYCTLAKKYEDNPEKLAKQCKGKGDLEVRNEKITITDHKDREKDIDEVIATLYGNNHEVPLLVVFANKLLKIARDFYEDIEKSDKYHALSNFFELFYHIAESGPEMKRYMVQSRFIGTLLDIYYDKNTNNKHYHRDLSHLATYDLVCNGDNDSNRDSSNRNISPEDIEEKGEKNVDFSFALSIMKKQKQQDDLVVESKEKSKKKRESDEEDHPSYGITKPYKENDEKRFPFIIRTISSLICSCKFLLSGRYIAEDSLFLNVGEANNILEIEERVISLICSDEVINELVIRSNMLFSTREAVHVMYSHLMWNNLDVSNKIMEILIAEICNKESTFSDVIKQTPFLVEISKINDELSPERMEKLIKNIYEDTFMEEYKTSIKYSDSMLSLILQVIRRNYDACKYMRELDDPLKPIEKFTIEHPIPKVTSSKQVLFKNLSDDKIDKQFSEADKNMLREYGEYRLAQFKDLLVDLDWEDHIKTFVRKEGEQYIDPDIVYIPGQKVDYFKEEYKHWIDAEVIEDYGPALQVSYRVPEIIMNIERLQSYKPAVKIVKDSVRPHEVFTTDLYQKSNGLYLYLYEKAIDKKQRGIRNIHR